MQPNVELRGHDLHALTRVPQLSASGYVSLIKSLLAVKPVDPPVMIAAAIVGLERALAETEAAFVSRLSDAVNPALERNFDGFVDRLWIRVRGRLEDWALYTHSGIKMLDEDDLASIDLPQRHELAQIAQDLHLRMFGAKGGSFLQLPYPQQAAEMSTRLQLIRDKGLEASFERIVGADLFELLKICQRRYEAMVQARGAREPGSIHNLSELRHRLQRAISLYSGVIAGLLNVHELLGIDAPEAARIVERALRPNLVARSQRRRAPARSPLEEEGSSAHVADEDAHEAPSSVSSSAPAERVVGDGRAGL